MPAAKAVRIFISAGEASGDYYGSLLIEALRERFPAAEFTGCGGERMRAAGCRTIVDANQLAMVGILEVAPGLARALRALKTLAESARARRPEIAVLIDFPDFNLRLARRLKRLGTPVVYFVAPQVWAWRRGRLKILRRYVDRLLCIFPFEEKFFRAAGVGAEFVGHPLVNRAAPKLDAAEFRARYGLGEADVVGLLPGSRHKEILLNLPPMLKAAEMIQARCSKPVRFVLPAASTISASWLRGQLGSSPPVAVVEGATYDALAWSTCAIVASGTASTEAALLGTPMAIVYRVSPASWHLARWLVDVPFFSMVNIVAGRALVKEFIQDDFQPEKVAEEILSLLHDASARERCRAELREVAARLRGGASLKDAAGGATAPTNVGQEECDAIQRSVAIIESILSGEAAPAGSRVLAVSPP